MTSKLAKPTQRSTRPRYARPPAFHLKYASSWSTWRRLSVGDEGRHSAGAVVSPMLANIYLHCVFDLWVQAWRQTVARGDVIVVRYADGLVVGFESREEAERFLQGIRGR